MLLQNWGNFVLLQIGASVITNWSKCYYKLGQLFFITNWGSLIITNQGKFYYKSGRQLLQIRATVITNWGKRYYKLGQLLQIGAIITNWDITGTLTKNLSNDFSYTDSFIFFSLGSKFLFFNFGCVF